jgi:hypothetical protein
MIHKYDMPVPGELYIPFHTVDDEACGQRVLGASPRNLLACLSKETIQLWQGRVTISGINRVVMIQPEYAVESCSEFAQLS